MKKYAWIAISSFALGLLLAGYVFLYLPEKNAAPPDVFAKATPSAPAAASNLFASSLPQEKATLDFVTIAEKIGPAVVRIEAERRETAQSQGLGDDWPFGDDFFNRIFPQPRQSQPESNTVQVGGTGFFISADGYILTNNHIVEKDKTVRVTVTTLAGDEYDAKIIGTDPRTDLALLKIEAKDHALRRARRFRRGQGRRVGPGHRQPLRHGAHRHGRHRQLQGPVDRHRRATRTSSRPTPPSTAATAAGRSST